MTLLFMRSARRSGFSNAGRRPTHERWRSRARQLHIPITSKTSHSLVNTECTTSSLLLGKTGAHSDVSIRLCNHASQNVGLVVSLLAQLHDLEHNVEEQHAFFQLQELPRVDKILRGNIPCLYGSRATEYAHHSFVPSTEYFPVGLEMNTAVSPANAPRTDLAAQLPSLIPHLPIYTALRNFSTLPHNRLSHPSTASPSNTGHNKRT